jgi:hypothetical protein
MFQTKEKYKLLHDSTEIGNLVIYSGISNYLNNVVYRRMHRLNTKYSLISIWIR